MTRIFLFILFFSGLGLSIQAQQIAKTKSGRLVVLFENGTWKYAEKASGDKAENFVQTKKADTPVLNFKFELKDVNTEKIAFIHGPSAKLKKYFKQKNIVHADLALSSEKGVASLNVDWKIMTGEAFSYFGYIKPGNRISIELMGGKVVDLIYTEEFDPKEFERYGFSTYSTHLSLSHEQIALLQSSIITKVIMTWSKRSEEYKVINPAYFINELPKLIKE